MAEDQKLEQQISDYAALGKEDKNIDVAALMMKALQNEDANNVSQRQKRIAYLVSVGLPPVGLFFALYYYFSDKGDAKKVANICILLTLISIGVFWLLAKIMLSSSGTSVQQIEQIKPSDIQQLTQ